MNSDSLDQWQQLTTGEFTNWHPAFHTLFMWSVSRAWDSPAAVAMVQVLALGALVGWSIRWMVLNGLERRFAWTVSIVLAIVPATTITLWKDVPFGLGIAFFTIVLLQEVSGGRGLTEKRWGFILLSLVAIATSLFHHTGLPIVPGILGVWGIVRFDKIKPIALVVGVVLGSWFLVQGPVYEAFDVGGIPHPGIAGVVIHHLAAHDAAGTARTPEETEELRAVLPENAAPLYDCTTIDPLIFAPGFGRLGMQEQSPAPDLSGQSS